MLTLLSAKTLEKDETHMANEKSKAEQYRDERKARIAKAAKQNAKGMEKRNSAKKAAGKVISIILVAVIAIGIVASTLNYYGVWDRTIVIGGVGEDNVKVTAAEYEYYYMTVYNSFISNMGSYASQYGYDTSVGPDQQTGVYTDSTTGEEIAWADYIRDGVIQQIKQIKTYYNEAVKAGMELSAADKATVDTQIESFRSQAESMGDSENGHKYSLNAFLRFYYGPFNERFLRKVVGQQVLAYAYAQNLVDKYAEGYSQDEIDKAYNSDKECYDVVDFRVYTFSSETLTAEDGETDEALAARQTKADAEVKKNAEDFLKAAKDEQSFIAKAKALNASDTEYDAETSTKIRSATKDTVSENFSDEIATWLFTASTKAGAVKLFETDGSYTIILLTKAMHQENTVNVRHILFMTVDSSTGEDLDEDAVAEAKKNADDALAKWNKGDKTEDSFAALAAELSEDTGSQSNGGLYENVLPGSMVAEFDSWIFDANRKPGDTEIVKTDYGYHVMYFVGANEKPYYDAAIRDEKAQVEAEAEVDEVLNAETNTIRFGVDNKGKGISYAEKKVLKKISTLLQMNSSSSSSSYSY